MLSFDFKHSTEQCTLLLSGQLRGEDSVELERLLLDLFEKTNVSQLLIDHKNVTEIAFPCIETYLSVHQKVEEIGKSMSILWQSGEKSSLSNREPSAVS
ncbi:MAG: hypothetical protein GY757_43680 [bacterium]|nr:hypothetical protein [bacterium]